MMHTVWMILGGIGLVLVGFLGIAVAEAPTDRQWRREGVDMREEQRTGYYPF